MFFIHVSCAISIKYDDDDDDDDDDDNSQPSPDLFTSESMLVQLAGRPPVHGRTPAASGRRCTVDGRETTTEELVVFQINFHSNNVSVN